MEENENTEDKIWMLTLQEYLHRALQYFRKTGKYPQEIQAFLDGDELEILDKSLREPSERNVAGLGHVIHKIAVVTAWEQGKKIPQHVSQDYPWLQAKKLELPKNTFEYYFNNPNFKSADNFKDFLKFCEVDNPQYRLCTQFPLMDQLCYLWQGEEIRIVTLENPLQSEGFTRVLVMQGEMGAVLSAVRYIQQHTGATGEEGLYYVDFSTLHCLDRGEENNLFSHTRIPGPSEPNIYQVKKFGEFLSDYPLSELQLSGDKADPSAYKFPWEMSVNEFVIFVENYVRKFNVYPLEITEALNMIVHMRPELKEIQQQRPSVELGAKAAVPAHLLLVSKALWEHKPVPTKILDLYPGLAEQMAKQDYFQYSFNTVNFGSAQRFKVFLLQTRIRNGKKCSHPGRPVNERMYLWTGENIEIITGVSPLRKDGYASFMIIAGKKEDVLRTARYVEEHTHTKGEERREYVDFTELICLDPPGDASPAVDPTGKSPSPTDIEIKQPDGKKNAPPPSGQKNERHPTDQLKNFASFLSQHDVINGYIDDGEIKETFGKLGKKAFKELALYLGLKEYTVTFNKGGIAVSGDLILMGMFETGGGIYISFNKESMKDSTNNVLNRTIRDMKDFTGGINHWFPEAEFADPERIRQRVLSLFKKKESPASQAEPEKKEEPKKDVPADTTLPASGSDLIKHIDEALQKGDTDAAIEMIGSLAGEMQQGHYIDQLPALLAYKQRPELRKELSWVHLFDVVNSEAFGAVLDTNLWKLIPEDYKTIRTLKPINWKADPSDKALRLILSDFTSDNTLSPALWGASFDKKGIVATDATKLIFINTPNPSKKGIYCITKFCFKSLGKEDTEEAVVKEKFPDYVKVLPGSIIITHTVSTETIRTFCNTLKKTKLLDERRPVGTFRFGERKFIQIDTDYLESCATAFVRLGYSSIDIGFIHFDKVMVMTPVGKMKDVSSLNTPFALVMPFVLNPKEAYVPQRGTLYFDFSDETVGTVGIEETVSLEKETPTPKEEKAVSSEQDTLHLLTNGNWFSQHPDKVLHGSAEEIAEQLGKTLVAKSSSPAQEKQTEKSDYLDRVVAVMFGKYAKQERATKKQIETLAGELGISNLGKMWEAVELSWLLWYKMLYREPYDFETRLSRMTAFWNKVQPTYQYSDSSKEIYKQYSTPCPIAAIVSQYTGMNKAKSIFEPSAGNGLFLLGADPSKTSVNEIDPTRLESLRFQGFKTITSLNAAQPFPEEMTHKFDVVVTNPPFTRWEDDKFDKDYLIRKYFHNHIGLSKHLRLEHVMAGLALHTMKDTGKAAIIIMGHLYFSEDGYIGKYRPFFNWLYRHYHVEDVINLNSFKLYNKQGAIERTMLILINGRKAKPEGVAPRKTEAPQLEEMVNSFAELWERVKRHLKTELDLIIEQLKIAIAA